jgi:hypothetical protein
MATNGGMGAGGVFEVFEPWIRLDLVRRYQALGALVCAYAQGSLVERLAREGDIDVVLVWRDDLPVRPERPPSGLADPEPQPLVFDHEPSFVVDRFWHAGQQFDVKHIVRAEVDSWVEAVEAGEGRSGYPMPVVGIHGLVNGVVLADSGGYAAGIRERMRHVPAPFRRAAWLSGEAAEAFLQELRRCVDRGDYLLFHSLAVEAIRAAFIGWFAARDLYWPHEKRLSERLALAGYPDLAELERAVWSKDGLAARLEAIDALLSRLRDDS